MIRCIATLALLLPSLAFAGWESVQASKRVGCGKGDFSLQLPETWLYDSSRHSLDASHDGVGLNRITVAITPFKKTFKNANKEVTSHSAPDDLAEDYIAELQAGPNAVSDLVVVSNEPAQLAGRPAFRVHVTYRAPASAGGAAMESVAIGTALDSGVMLATFEAPSIHYFERWIREFDAVAGSITLLPPPK
jgi:hypothetical protein